MSNISFNPLAWAIRPLYLKAIAEDPAFAQEVKEKESRTEKPKSLSECADYILGEAYHWASEHRDGNLGYAGLPDDEMVNLIKHYYDEENIEIRKVTNARAQVTKSEDKKKEDKPKKEEKKTPKVVQIPKSLKESISDTHIQMTRPKDEREAKRNSKVQAEQVKVIDMFAGMWDEEADETKAEEEEVEEVEEVAVEDDDDLPM